MNTIDPRFIDVMHWTAMTSTVLAPYGTVPILPGPEQWTRWASIILTIPALAALNPPRPERFADWREWASQFNMAAQLLTTPVP